MITIELTRYHLPERCVTEHHISKVFLFNEETSTHPSLVSAIEKLTAWNRQCPCWQYAITRCRPATHEEMSGKW